MKLPRGVSYNPGLLGPLVSTQTPADALITIASDPQEYGSDVPYQIVPRNFEQNFQPLFSEDYHDFDRRYHLSRDTGSNLPVYSGAQHGSEAVMPDAKLPNITVPSSC